MIYVIGGSGKVGSELIRLLREVEGAPVRALVRSEDSKRKIKPEGVDFVLGDVDQTDVLKRSMEGCESLFIVTPADLKMVEVQCKAVDTAKSSGIKHVVKLSGLGAGEWPVSIGRWHRKVEEHIENSGMTYTHLRPNIFMQNFLMSADSIKKEGAFYAPMEGANVSFIDARDIALVASKVLTGSGHENKIYPITGPESLSYADVSVVFSEVLGKTVRFINVEPEVAKAGMLKRGMPEWFADAFISIFGILRDNGGNVESNTVAQIGKQAPRSVKKFIFDHSGVFK